VFFRVFPWLVFGMMIDTRYGLYEKSPNDEGTGLFPGCGLPFWQVGEVIASAAAG